MDFIFDILCEIGEFFLYLFMGKKGKKRSRKNDKDT